MSTKPARPPLGRNPVQCIRPPMQAVAPLWEVRMSEKLYPVSPEWAKRAYVDDAKYKDMYEASVKDPDEFWGEHGKRVDWIKPFTNGA